jgi:peptidoglycan/LPS O-acetylase OafA/YrhL
VKVRESSTPGAEDQGARPVMVNIPVVHETPNEVRAAFLDGMRGWAALMVLGSHLFFVFCNYDRAQAGQWFLRFPCDGTLAVYIFFVLSGFALSTQFIKSKDRGILASLALRRYLRLTVPILVSVLLAWALMSAGFMANGRAAALMGNGYLASFYNFVPSFKGALSYSLWDIYFRYQDVFPTSYNRVLWTMSYELYGSLLVFLLLALFGTLRSRFAIYAAFGILFCLTGQPAMVAFVFGIGLAEFYHHRAFGRLGNHAGSLALSLLLLLAGWIYSSFHPDYSPKPLDLPFVAMLMVFGVIINRRVRKLFETRLSLFMGHISFPLYLTHLLVICSLTSALYIALAAMGIGARTALFLAAAVTLPVCLAVARAFQPVETAGISLSKRFANAVLRRTP